MSVFGGRPHTMATDGEAELTSSSLLLQAPHHPVQALGIGPRLVSTPKQLSRQALSPGGRGSTTPMAFSGVAVERAAGSGYVRIRLSGRA